MAAARFLTASPDRALQQAGARLLTACSMSLLLHLAVLGIPVNATGGAPHVVARLYARLEPAADRGQQVRETTLAPTEKAGAPAGADARSRPDAVEAEAASVAGMETPPSRDATYYPAQQLDVYPLPLAPIRLHHPDSAAGLRRDGRLLLQLLIDESGAVNAASVVDAQPEGRFEAAAMSVLRATRFAPAQKQGYPVKSRVLLQISYTYGDREEEVR